MKNYWLTFPIAHKQLEEYFLGQFSTEQSMAISITDNVLLLGDYHVNYLNKTEKLNKTFLHQFHD